jgi:hypothetical protein
MSEVHFHSLIFCQLMTTAFFTLTIVEIFRESNFRRLIASLFLQAAFLGYIGNFIDWSSGEFPILNTIAMVLGSQFLFEAFLIMNR